MSGVLKFVSGNPSDEEVAAVVAVLHAQAAAASAAETPQQPVRSGWARPAHVRLGRPRSWDESRLPRS